MGFLPAGLHRGIGAKRAGEPPVVWYTALKQTM